MHPLLTQKILEGCRERSAAGRDVTRGNTAHGPETYEDCIISLGAERDAAPRKTMETLIEVFVKVCPEVLPVIEAAHAKVQARDEAFDRLMAILRPEPPTHENTKIPLEHTYQVLRAHGYTPEKVLDEPRPELSSAKASE